MDEFNTTLDFSATTLTPLLFVFILGLLVGSFLNVCIYRIPLEKTVVKGRSFCPSCEKPIPWYLNIPLLSYIFLQGRCRFCGSKISPSYPLIELLNGLLTLFCFVVYGFNPTALFAAALFSLLIVIAFIDIHHRIIPDGLVVAVTIVALLNAVHQIFFLQGSWHLYFFGILAASLPLLILGLIYPDGMGGGDVKFMAAAGLFVGWKLILLSLFFGCLIALLYVIIQMIRRIPLKGVPIPFAPFLSAGIIIAQLWGIRIVGFYLKLVWGL
ncbi:MAG: prepilin peptidase [Anaerovoracaceae bacterium]